MADRMYTAGLQWLQLFLLDSAGVAAGLRGTSWANGESTGAFVVDGRREATFTVDGGSTTPIEEGNEVVGNWQWGGSSLSEVSVELSDDDPDLDALIGGTNVLTSSPSSHYSMWTDEEELGSRPMLGAILTELAQGADGIDGTKFFKHTLIMRATARVTSSGARFQDKNNRTLILTPMMSVTTPFGLNLASLLGVNRGKLSALKFKSNKLVGLHSFKKDGEATTFTLGYKPFSSSAVAATGPNLMFDNGAVTNPTSVATSTGLVTLSAAGTAGQKVVMLYEHEGAPA